MSGLRLAARAPERHPLLERGPLIRAPDGAAAAPAGPAGPAVDPGLLTARRIAGGDLTDPFLVRLQHPPRQLHQFGHGVALRRPPPRADTAQEERLRLIQVADPGQVPLVHDRLAD